MTVDPSWSGVLLVRSLGELSGPEADQLLESRRVPTGVRKSVLAFAGGRPPTLSLAADTARRCDSAAGSGRSGDEVLQTLLTESIETVPTLEHRMALHVCAHADTTSEQLLQARRYDAWYRHITLAMLAHTYLGYFRNRPKSPGSGLIPLALGEVERLLAHLITIACDRSREWAWSPLAQASSTGSKNSHYLAKTGHYEVRLEHKPRGVEPPDGDDQPEALVEQGVVVLRTKSEPVPPKSASPTSASPTSGCHRLQRWGEIGW